VVLPAVLLATLPNKAVTHLNRATVLLKATLLSRVVTHLNKEAILHSRLPTEHLLKELLTVPLPKDPLTAHPPPTVPLLKDTLPSRVVTHLNKEDTHHSRLPTGHLLKVTLPREPLTAHLLHTVLPRPTVHLQALTVPQLPL